MHGETIKEKKINQCDLSALQQLIIHSLQKGRNKKGASLSG